MDPRDELICLGHDEPLEERDGAIMPPIVQTSLFAKPRFEDLIRSLEAEHEHRVYTRGCNPTVEALEQKLATLEGGEAAKCFGSGMGAVNAVLSGLLQAGDHILFVNHVYGPTLQLAQHLTRFGINHDHTLARDISEIATSLRSNTRLIYFESPGTMMFRQLDISGLSELARSRNILTVIDNTWATPLYQKPLAMGVDLSLHSTTKYIGGHSDVVGGVVVGKKDLLKQIFYNAFLLNGAAPAPMDAYLLIRGLRTLPVRMRQHQEDALLLARFLKNHPGVREVYHPAVMEEEEVFCHAQLTGFSGLFSIVLADDRFSNICRFIDGLQLFRTGVSWGGVESLVISPNRGDNLETLDRAGIPRGLVRLSVGLEGVDALRSDLEKALEQV